MTESEPPTALSVGVAILLLCAGSAAASDLIRAAEANQPERVEALIAGAADPNAPGEGGVTALHQAASHGHTAVAALLLRNGAYVDQAEHDGDTALMNAAYSGHLEMVELLIANGADQKLEGSLGMTAIQYAREEGHREVVRALRAAQLPPPRLPPQGDRPSARPQSYEPGYARRLAVVIGIDKYQKWPHLDGATGDARRIAKRLRALGFDEVMELFDEEATRSAILELLGTQLTSKTGEEDLVVVFFAGHGQTETLPRDPPENRGYIVPVDGDIARPFSTAIPMHQLRDLRGKLKAKHVYYAMDSCYSGLGFTRGLSIVAAGATNYINKVTSKRSVQMVTAGGEGEEAIERDGKGLFTTWLLAALSGAADTNRDGWVTASEIGAYVVPHVTEDTHGAQTPQVGRLDGEGEIAFKIWGP